jgi:hypothetical protein
MKKTKFTEEQIAFALPPGLNLDAPIGIIATGSARTCRLP